MVFLVQLKGYCKSKHDNIIMSLEDRVQNESEYLFNNLEYSKKSRVIGEIDLLRYNDKELYLYEIKSTYSKKAKFKAMSQLDRAFKYLVPIVAKELSLNYVNGIMVFGKPENNKGNRFTLSEYYKREW